MTELSVVIPTKNEEKSIGKCIEKIQKVFNERHINGEIIVADNSTDNTTEIAKGMGAKVIVPDKLGYGNAYMRVRLSNPSLHQPLPLNIRIASLAEINVV